MKKTLAYSVRLEKLIRISDDAHLAVGFDGTKDIIPTSQIFGQDFEVVKSDSYWISAWILSIKKITYSKKKQAYFDEKGHMVTTLVEYYVPDKKESLSDNIKTELKK